VHRAGRKTAAAPHETRGGSFQRSAFRGDLRPFRAGLRRWAWSKPFPSLPWRRGGGRDLNFNLGERSIEIYGMDTKQKTAIVVGVAVILAAGAATTLIVQHTSQKRRNQDTVNIAGGVHCQFPAAPTRRYAGTGVVIVINRQFTGKNQENRQD